MPDNKDLFSTYKAINRSNVVFGSNTKSKIIRKGTISTKSVMGRKGTDPTIRLWPGSKYSYSSKNVRHLAILRRTSDFQEVHPVLPNRDDMMHGRPNGKIRLYTRFFDFANFRFPLSTFLVDVLKYFHINISQLSVIGASKGDDFACPASFLWHTSKHVIRDPAPVAADFNEQDYATLVAHPSLFWKFQEAFMCLVGLSRHYILDEETYPWFLHKNREEMEIFAFIHTLDPTKVKIIERELNKGEPLLLETTIGHTISLLLVAPDRGGKDAVLQPVIEAADTVVEEVAPVKPKRQGKRKSMVVDAGEASHPPKNLREDHETLSGTSVGGKSISTLKRLLTRAVLNVEVRVAAIPTLPFMTTSISTTSEHEGGDHIDSVAGLNLCAIGAPPRFIISLDSSHYSGTNVAEVEVNSLVRSSVSIMTTITTINLTVDPALVAKEKLVDPSLFCVGSSLAGGTDPTTGGFSDLTGVTFFVTNGSCLDGRVCHEMADEFAPLKFFLSVHEMKHDQLFIEFNVRAARQISLSAEVRKGEIEHLKPQLSLRETEAAEVIRLRAQASNFEVVEKSFQDEMNVLKVRNAILEKERNALDVKVYELEISSFRLQKKVAVYENCMDQLEKFQDDQMKVVNDKFDKLYTDFVDMALHLEEKPSPSYYRLRPQWLLTHGMELAIVKCLNSPEYLSALGKAIGKAIKKNMQGGLSARIVHGKEGRVLTDVDAHNPSAKVDYTSALQHLQNVNFSLLAELKSNKDASVETVMEILHLEGPLTEKLGLNELQPNVNQLMIPIHRSSDKVVLGATALSLSLDVSSFQVRRIRVNIANKISTLRDVFVPLAQPFPLRFIALISVDDYEVLGADDQVVVDGNAASFLNVDDAELNIP
nr:transposase (putative), gypsy type [Tanacetum cinerariifolium]